jgi:hypothetical protein
MKEPTAAAAAAAAAAPEQQMEEIRDGRSGRDLEEMEGLYKRASAAVGAGASLRAAGRHHAQPESHHGCWPTCLSYCAAVLWLPSCCVPW